MDAVTVLLQLALKYVRMARSAALKDGAPADYLCFQIDSLEDMIAERTLERAT